jgi:hypothetical protein
VVNGYTRYLRPDPRELALLAAVMRVRPSVFEVWAFAADRKTVIDAARAVAGIRAQADTLAADLDHTIAWDHGGLTCECGLAPQCQR